MKWLAVAVAAAVVGLLLLWRELRAPSAAAPTAAAPTVTAPRPPAPAPARPTTTADDDADDRLAIIAAPEDAPIARFSDEFWERVDEVYSRRLLGFAADCYHGGKDRKQKLKLAYRLAIVDGQVSVRDVRIEETTLGDPGLEQCMVKAVATATFADPRMPDWSSKPTEEEMVLIRIETLKRFAPASD